MKTIEYKAKALKSLMRFPRNDQVRIRSKIEQLAEDPDLLKNNVKALQGQPGFRLRVGNYRILCKIVDDALVINDVDVRGNVY